MTRSILRAVEPSDASVLVREVYRKDIGELGYVPPHTRLMALDPVAHAAWEDLIPAIAGPMDERRYEPRSALVAPLLRPASTTGPMTLPCQAPL